MNHQADDLPWWLSHCLTPQTLQSYMTFHEKLSANGGAEARAERQRRYRSRRAVRLGDFFSKNSESNVDAGNDS